MDANTKAIAEVLRRWHEAPSAKVIDFAAERKRRQERRYQVPRPTPPRAA